MVASRTESGAEKRRHKRRSGMWSAAIEAAPGHRVDGVILDLSESGAKLRLEHPAAKTAPGAVVTFLAERTGRRPARIVWSEGTRVGLEFLADDGAPARVAAPTAQTPRVDAAGNTASNPVALDPAFLRGRAKVLRELAANGATPEAAARLRAAADGLDHEADAILRRRAAPGEC
jgi:hypothetical protein